MRLVRDPPSGLRLIIAVVCLLLLVLPGVVFAATLDNTTPGMEVTTSIVPNVTSVPATPVPTVIPVYENTTSIVPNVTSVPATPVPTVIPVYENTTSIVSNVTSVPTTPVPPVLLVRENTTVTVNPPPLLIFDTPLIENMSCTIYGIVDPGSVNVTIVSIRWDWGDSYTPEYHGFPYSHVYSSPGIYTLSITARQSDGQNVTGTTKISVGQPLIPPTLPVTPTTSAPGGPVIVISAPVLTLLEPVIDRTNVTLNGNLNAGSPGVTITSVSVDWNDGYLTKSADLPVTHQYSRYGIYTVTITGNQSDGQSATRRITLDLKEEIPAVPGTVPSGSPPGNDSPVYIIILATAIIVMAIVIVGQWITQRKRDSLPDPGIPKVFSPRNGPLSENLPSSEEMGTICSGTGVAPDVLGSVIQVAVEIAREGREGQAIGTAFVVGDSENVLNHSKQFVLNPFHGHHEAERQITDVGIQGTIKEFAQLDGAFLITGTGVVEAAGRCITVDMSQVNLPGGMGSRHSSVAGITQVTRSIGVVVSQSGGLISIFREGKIVYTIKS
jgi:DNA integrity scanning protein DisA with diadenylate cyclase activity